MALMTLGMFVFDLPTLTYKQMQRRSSWRHPTSDRVGARPKAQFAGPGDDDVTLSGLHIPAVMGAWDALDVLRDMAGTGDAFPLVDGAGYVYGAYVITSLDETKRSITDNGVARISDFSISLKRVDDDLPDDGEMFEDTDSLWGDFDDLMGILGDLP